MHVYFQNEYLVLAAVRNTKAGRLGQAHIVVAAVEHTANDRVELLGAAADVFGGARGRGARTKRKTGGTSLTLVLIHALFGTALDGAPDHGARVLGWLAAPGGFTLVVGKSNDTGFAYVVVLAAIALDWIKLHRAGRLAGTASGAKNVLGRGRGDDSEKESRSLGDLHVWLVELLLVYFVRLVC